MAERVPRNSSGDRVRQLTQLSRAFSNAESLDEILKLAVRQAAELVYADRAILMLADDAGLLRVRATYGVDAATAARFEHPMNESLPSRLRGLLGSQLAAGFIGVPLVSRGSVVGLLAAVREDGGMPSEEDESILSALADQVSAPLENARLAKQLDSGTLLAENVRLYEAERAARLVAEAALRQAEEARDAALQADTSKTSFLAAMSHELRTPLNAIGGYVELLEMGLRGPLNREQSDDLKRIKASQAHLLRLITEVLEYARLGAGEAELHIDDVDLNSVLRECEVMIFPQAAAKGLSYSYDTCDGGVIVRADAQRLRQIVLNLLSNAVKFTHSGGDVRMTCRVERETTAHSDREVARVYVQDTGRGIPANLIDEIWQPFVQLGRQLNHPAEGVGLGLAISRDLARRIGGELSVVSEVAKGSTFTLTLPISSDG